MVYTKPEILAQSTVQMAECRPNSKPSGRPCNPPKTKWTLMDNLIRRRCYKTSIRRLITTETL